MNENVKTTFGTAIIAATGVAALFLIIECLRLPLLAATHSPMADNSGVSMSIAVTASMLFVFLACAVTGWILNLFKENKITDWFTVIAGGLALVFTLLTFLIMYGFYDSGRAGAIGFQNILVELFVCQAIINAWYVIRFVIKNKNLFKSAKSNSQSAAAPKPAEVQQADAK